MNTTTRVLMAALLCTAAVACSKKVKETPPPVDTGTGAATDTAIPTLSPPTMREFARLLPSPM